MTDTTTVPQMTSAECRVLEYLASGKSRSTTQVVTAVPRSRSTVMHALRSLEDAGAIVRRDGPDGSNQWRVASDDEAER